MLTTEDYKRLDECKDTKDVLKALEDIENNFYASLDEGDIVHYNNGFKNFVRNRATNRVRLGLNYLKKINPND
jgi:uncharacterized protein YktA (UPF0223 family)